MSLHLNAVHGTHEDRFESGETVLTPMGKGIVSFWVYAPPSYTRISHYVVLLANKQEERFPANQVRPTDTLDRCERARG